MNKTKLRPCPFCGKEPAETKGQKSLSTSEFDAVFCRCTNFYRMAKEKWQNAYCWKEIDRLEALNAVLVEAEKGE